MGKYGDYLKDGVLILPPMGDTTDVVMLVN